jgi:hypothetical protein
VRALGAPFHTAAHGGLFLESLGPNVVCLITSFRRDRGHATFCLVLSRRTQYSTARTRLQNKKMARGKPPERGR